MGREVCDDIAVAAQTPEQNVQPFVAQPLFCRRYLSDADDLLRLPLILRPGFRV